MSDRFRIDGRVAVVTGALGNLGPVWAQALLEAGATVVGLDLPDARPNAAFAALQSAHPGKLSIMGASVTDRAALSAARDQVLAKYDVPSVLVNNAGIDAPPAASGGGYRLEDIPFDINRRIFEVNTLGLFQVTQLFGAFVERLNRRTLFIKESAAGEQAQFRDARRHPQLATPRAIAPHDELGPARCCTHRNGSGS